MRLLGDVRSTFDRGGCDRLGTTALLAGLAEDDESPWADWQGKGRLTAHGLAGLLRRYEIRSRSVRLADGSTPKGYRREQFEDAWNRYLPENRGSSRHNATTGMATGIAANLDPPQDCVVADRESGANPHGYGVVADVADRKAETAVCTTRRPRDGPPAPARRCRRAARLAPWKPQAKIRNDARRTAAGVRGPLPSCWPLLRKAASLSGKPVCRPTCNPVYEDYAETGAAHQRLT